MNVLYTTRQPRDYTELKYNLTLVGRCMVLYFLIQFLLLPFTISVLLRSNLLSQVYFDSYLFIFVLNDVFAYILPIIGIFIVKKRMEHITYNPRGMFLAYENELDDSILFNETFGIADEVRKPPFHFKYVHLPLYMGLVTLVGYVCGLITVIIESFFVTFTEFSGINDVFESLQPSGEQERWIYLIAIAVIPPVFEEYIYRRLLLQPLRAGGDIFAVLISSFFFALIHSNFGQFLYAFGVGIILGAVTVNTGKLLPAIILHCYNNLFSVILSFIGTDDTNTAVETAQRNIGGEIYFMVLLLGVFAVFFFIGKIRANNKFKRLNMMNGTHYVKDSDSGFFSEKMILFATNPAIAVSLALGMLMLAASVNEEIYKVIYGFFGLY